MRMRLRQQMIMKCTICKESFESHAQSCPVRLVDYLFDSKSNIQCSECNEREVEINGSDFYECRSCNTQFTAGETLKTDKITILCNWKDDTVINVSIMASRGRGDFPIDKRIEEAIKAVDKAREKS